MSQKPDVQSSENRSVCTRLYSPCFPVVKAAPIHFSRNPTLHPNPQVEHHARKEAEAAEWEMAENWHWDFSYQLSSNPMALVQKRVENPKCLGCNRNRIEGKPYTGVICLKGDTLLWRDLVLLPPVSLGQEVKENHNVKDSQQKTVLLPQESGIIIAVNNFYLW